MSTATEQNKRSTSKLPESIRRDIRAKAKTITAKEFNRRYALMMDRKAAAHQ